MSVNEREDLDFSVHIQGGDTQQVAQLITSILETPEGCQDEYEYVPGWTCAAFDFEDRSIGKITWREARHFTSVERRRRTRSDRYKETVLIVHNEEGTDLYDIRFRDLEPPMARKVRSEMEAAFNPHQP